MTTNLDSGIILNVLRAIGEHLQILPAKPPKKLNTVDVASFAKARIEEDKRVMEKAIEQGYNPHLVKSSKVQNELYKGDNYTVKFNEYEVTITNESKQYTRKINLSNVLAGMNEKDKIEKDENNKNKDNDKKEKDKSAKDENEKDKIDTN